VQSCNTIPAQLLFRVTLSYDLHFKTMTFTMKPQLSVSRNRFHGNGFVCVCPLRSYGVEFVRFRHHFVYSRSTQHCRAMEGPQSPGLFLNCGIIIIHHVIGSLQRMDDIRMPDAAQSAGVDSFTLRSSFVNCSRLC
jgi:hypothetical protein